MRSGEKRVEFRAPERLIERIDALAAALGEDRPDVLVRALRSYLDDATQGDAIAQEIAGAYYDDEISGDELDVLVQPETAANVRVLNQQLDEDYVEELTEE